MGNVPKREMSLKIKALQHAFNELKTKSTPSNNHVGYQNITDVANTTEWALQLHEPISIETIHQSTNPEIIKLRKDIKDFKKHLKDGKAFIGNITKNRISDLEAKVDSLTIDLVCFQDKNDELENKIKTLKNSLKKARSERDGYIQKLKDHEL